MYLNASFETGSMHIVNLMTVVVQAASSMFLAYFNTRKEA